MEGRPPFICYSHKEKDKCKAPNDSIICDEILDIDSLFETTVYRGATLTWQKGRQLASINTDSSLVNFKYNIDGLRTEKKVGTKTYSYIWSSGLLMQQSDGTNTLNFSYSPDGRPLGVLFNGSSYYYIYNLQGDVIGLYNYLGSVVVRYSYDSWGKLISTTGSLSNTLGKLNPFRYRGYIYDEETGFYYLKSRYYAPEICRFLSADVYISTGTGLNGYNMFAYCNNNPVQYVDNDGNRPISSTSIQNEPGDDRKSSCKHMLNVNSVSNSSSPFYIDLINRMNEYSYYLNRICDSLIDYVEVTTGLGIGYGLAFEAGDASFEGLAYFNPLNVSMTANSSKIYSSFYLGGSVEFLGFEAGPELHYVFDWSTLSFSNIGEDFLRFSDIEFGVAIYKKFGGIIKITIN